MLVEYHRAAVRTTSSLSMQVDEPEQDCFADMFFGKDDSKRSLSQSISFQIYNV